MDGAESSTVLEEVEALFKKLQHLPENIRQQALSCIQEKLPDALPLKDGDDGAELQEKESVPSPKKVLSTPKNAQPAKVTQKRSSCAKDKEADSKAGSISAKVEKAQSSTVEDPVIHTKGQVETEIGSESEKSGSNVKLKVMPKRSVKISSVSIKGKKVTSFDGGATSHSREIDTSEIKPDDSKKGVNPKAIESVNPLKEDTKENTKEEAQAQDKAKTRNDTKVDENLSHSESDVSCEKDASSPSRVQGSVKKPFIGPKSAKLARKYQKSPKIEKDESKDDDLPKPFAFEDVGPVFVLEDVRTLSGRKTKRLNLASLSGFRKPRVKLSAAPKDVKNDTGAAPSSLKQVKVEVSSEVAESAEILASLSSGIPHKEGASSVDCLKDKTNNQGPVITYEFETLPDGDNIGKESEEDSPETREEYVDLADSNSLIENVDSDVERDPLEDIERNSSGEYTCNFCDFKSTTKQSLCAHVRKHKENIPKAEHVCPECNKKFSQSCSLQLHLKRHRGERDFHCADCDYKAFTKVDLTRHQTIHTGERNKICEYCGKTFAKDSTLRDHVKSVHERKVKHACEMCGFVTHRANNLRVHIRMRHHGEYNNHVCPVCKASVKQKNAFLEHMRSHTGERPFKCESCTAAFACLARLNVHRNAVHGERQFKCEDCEKSFQTKHHLLRHRAIHTKERPYACPYCSYACNTQGNIAKHVRSIHNLPNFSYRKHKDLMENGGQPREIDPEWVKKGEEVTEEYLNELSAKMGRTITIEELWSKQEEMRKKKEEQIKARQEAKERRALKNEAAGAAYLEKVRKRRLERQQTGEISGKKLKHNSSMESNEDSDTEADCSETEVPLYQLVSQGGNIRLCLETDKVQVYTGDATREVPLLQVKEDMNDSEEIQTIQGYMNDDGQFIRIEDGVMVDEDSSTVVVIIDSEMQDEINPDVSDVMEVTCEEDFSNTETEELNLNVVSASKGDLKSKPSVLRVIKQEM